MAKPVHLSRSRTARRRARGNRSSESSSGRVSQWRAGRAARVPRHRRLCRVVGRSERDVVNRAGALTPWRECADPVQGHDVAERAPPVKRTAEPSRPGLLEAEDIGQHRRGRTGLLQEQRDSVEATDCVFLRNTAARPDRPRSSALGFLEREAHAVGVLEAEHALAEDLDERLIGDLLLGEALRPISERLPSARGTSVSLVSPTPRRPGPACSMGKKVTIVPGVPVSSP